MYPRPYPSEPVNPDAQMISDIARAINGQYSAISCYGQLAKNAPNEEQRKRIEEIRQDEMRHYRTFYNIYTQLTGRHPSPQIIENCPKDYREGLDFAFHDEQKTVDFYNEISDKAHNIYIRRSFERAARDEQNHAVWFLYFLKQR